MPANQLLMREVLDRHGHDVRIAENGADAVAAVRAHDHDLVLMDVQMPVMDGVTATREIRALQGAKGQIPIVGLTANAMTEQRAEYLAAGMDHCVTKPVRWPELMAAIARFAAHGRGVQLPVPREVESMLDAAAVFDEAVLGSVEGSVGSEKLHSMLHDVLVEARKCSGKMRSSAGNATRVAELAHRVRGMVGNFGFAKATAVAAEIERRASNKAAVEELIKRMLAAIDETEVAIDGRRRAA